MYDVYHTYKQDEGNHSSFPHQASTPSNDDESPFRTSLISDLDAFLSRENLSQKRRPS